MSYPDEKQASCQFSQWRPVASVMLQLEQINYKVMINYYNKKMFISCSTHLGNRNIHHLFRHFCPKHHTRSELDSSSTTAWVKCLAHGPNGEITLLATGFELVALQLQHPKLRPDSEASI